jgi:hypothetical protein
VRGLGATTRLVLARARRRPGRWLLTALGLALATAFAGAVAAESTITADRAAHSVLAGLSPLDRTVRVTWQGPFAPPVARSARSLLRGLGLGHQTEVVLLSPVRLGGVVVRPAAIDPLGAWIERSGTANGVPAGAAGSAAGSAIEPPGPCRRSSCPMLFAGPRAPGAALTAFGVRIPIAGGVLLRSAAPLGFVPGQPPGQPPLLLSGDPAGLGALPGLSGVYRTYDWLALLPTTGLHSWQLASIERRLQRAQATFAPTGSGFSLTAPFAGLDAARAQAGAAPKRLLLAGGGALAALALFVVLAAGGLRRDLDAELGRLAAAGARSRQCTAFVLTESALLCGAAILAGAVIALAAAVLLASSSGVPAGGVLAHSLITTTGAAALLAGWVCATLLVTLLLLVRGSRVAELPAVAAAAGLAVGLSRGASGSGALPILLAPLCCLAAGVVLARLAVVALRGGERLARHGPVMMRLAFVGLARAPGAPSLAIAFIAVSIGLGGFALAYRATLLRSSADQAANQVPLDATVAAGADFVTPLQVAPASRWAAVSRGSVVPVRRTEASFVSGGSSETVPALGLPAAVIPGLHGWRAGDSSIPLATLAGRLTSTAPRQTRLPTLAPGTRGLRIRAQAEGVSVSLTADLLDPEDNLEQVPLGQAGQQPRTLGAKLPAAHGGPWRLAGIELDEPSGLAITNGHQNAEGSGAPTQFTGLVSLGALREVGIPSQPARRIALGTWRALGAARDPVAGDRAMVIRFDTSGRSGLLRPPASSDTRPVPVLVDRQTAAASGPGQRLALEVDGLPVEAQVVGVLRRFPTIPAGAAGFVIADQQTLAAALDAQLPGQGRADELWISTRHPGRLQAALRAPPFTQFSGSFRAQIEDQLRSAPISRGVLGTLLAAAGLAGGLAVVGLLVTLLGGARDERIERDLIAQGVGPRGVQTELRLRMVLAAGIGVVAGLAIGVVLTTLAVATVQSAGPVAVPDPPLVTVAPWGALLLWGAVALALLAGASWLAARAITGRAAS